MDDAAASRHPFDITFLQPSPGILHRAVEHEGDGLESGVWVRIPKASSFGDVVIGHEEERIGGGQIARCYHQSGLVPLTVKTRTQRRYSGNTINRSLKH